LREIRVVAAHRDGEVEVRVIERDEPVERRGVLSGVVEIDAHADLRGDAEFKRLARRGLDQFGGVRDARDAAE
jgi:hypothetical protein